MIDGFEGCMVTLYPVLYSGEDSYGNVLETNLDPIVIDDVLIAPDDMADDIEDGRPYGIESSISLYMPASDSYPCMRGGSVEIAGERYDIVGDPLPWPVELVPTGRNLVVKVVRHDG